MSFFVSCEKEVYLKDDLLDLPDLKLKLNISALFKNISDRFEEFKRNPWLPLPFTRIQQAIGGIIPGTFWILGGYTSRGKTSTVVELATYLLKKDAVVVHFSLEEERKLTVSRYLANLTGIPILAQLKEKLNGEAARTLEDAKTYLSSKSLYIYDDVFDLLV